jgi:chromosomal replication initiation ATPase DnaA
MKVIAREGVVAKMLSRVASDGQITYEALMSCSRSISVVRARRRAWELLHTAGFSQPEIARMWNTDSSTVCRGIHAYERGLEQHGEERT